MKKNVEEQDVWNEEQQGTETMGNIKTQEILIMEAAAT